MCGPVSPLVAAAIVLGVAAMHMSTGAEAAGSAQPVTLSLADGPLGKFAKLMPVVKHPRCVNCHGFSDPFTGMNHGSGVIEEEDARPLLDKNGDHNFNAPEFNLVCMECHTDPDQRVKGFWHLAPKSKSFVGKTTWQLCRLWRHSAEEKLRALGRHSEGSSAMVRAHLHTDPLAALALEKGNKGIDGEPADKPPLEKDEFLALAEDWLKGSEDVPCAGWDGTITQTESVNLTTNHSRSGGDLEEHTTEVQNATRMTEIAVGGGADLRISVQGTERIDTTIVSRGDGKTCTSTVRTARVYGNPGGVTTATAQTATVAFSPGGAYTITIVGPEEKTTRVERIVSTSCGGGAIPDLDETQDFDHPAWTIQFDGVLADPKDQTRLKGSKTETVMQEQRAWLTANGGNAAPMQTRDNGELLPVPVEVTTTWDLQRRFDD